MFEKREGKMPQILCRNGEWAEFGRTESRHKKRYCGVIFPSIPFYFIGGCSGRDRTCDQVINSHLLYR